MTDVLNEKREEIQTCFLFGEKPLAKETIITKPIVESSEPQKIITETKPKAQPFEKNTQKIKQPNEQDDVCKTIQGFKSKLKKRRNTSLF